MFKKTNYKCHKLTNRLCRCLKPCVYIMSLAWSITGPVLFVVLVIPNIIKKYEQYGDFVTNYFNYNYNNIYIEEH